VTIDEELSKLEDSIRRLKIEYEAYFNGGLPRPPRDTLFRVETAIKKLSSDQTEMNFGQRFHFNQLAQKYAVYNDLWRKRLRDLEEGRGRREQLTIPEDLVRVVASDPEAETDKVNQLFEAWVEAKRQTGETVPKVDVGVFAGFIRDKTAEIKQKLGCEKVAFRIRVEEGQVKLRAGRG
jgi:hypothetical protein